MQTMTGRVLVVSAHPDDEVLGCGATIHKILSQGGQVCVLILGEGSTCRYATGLLSSAEARAAIAQRRGFADQALASLGVVNAVFGDLPCGRFDQVPLIDIGKQIEEQICQFQPDTVLTHFGQDANSDHRRAFNAVIAASRPVPGSPVRNVMSFETLSSTEWRFVETFQPNLFIDIDAHIDAKVKAFNFYFPTEGKEFPFPRCEEGLRLQARVRGMQVGLSHAEAFQIVRSVLTAR
jgi:LmbE family N-acetylglucosaminyl deacetylase